MRVDPKETEIGKFHRYMLGSVAPRPIALVSSIDGEGQVNLSPYSNFNFFGANPPTLVFSPSRRVRDNSVKHTLENVMEVPEVVINIVDYSMVEQMSLSSSEYDKGINEFIKSGLTEVPAEKVRPPRVAESPVSFECKVVNVVSLGEGPGSGNLVICEAVLMHVKDDILDTEGMIDPYRLDAVARLGGNWYARAQGEMLFEVPKPGGIPGMGFDQLPAEVFQWGLTGNQLARLANFPKRVEGTQASGMETKGEIAEIVRELVNKNRIDEAWKYIEQWLAKKS